MCFREFKASFFFQILGSYFLEGTPFCAFQLQAIPHILHFYSMPSLTSYCYIVLGYHICLATGGLSFGHEPISAWLLKIGLLNIYNLKVA